MKSQFLAALFGFAAVVTVTPSVARADGDLLYGLKIEEFEIRRGDENESLRTWSTDAFVGTDEVKVRWNSEAEYDTRANKFEKLENRVGVQVPISDFFDAKAGVRFDSPTGPNRKYGFIGIAGLAPQWFDLDADLFYSEKSNLSARLDADYEILITNRLILTPSAELNAAFSDDTPIEIKSGLTSVELGMRLSYDLVDRMISPYVGGVYERKLGNTADLLRSEGEDVEGWRAVVGLKMMF